MREAEISQKIASLYAEISADTTKLQAGLKNTSVSIKSLKADFASIASGIAIFTGVAIAAGKAIDITVGELVKYANEVRTISQISGESAEATSVLIQVADDYKLSSTDLTTAQRKLAIEGYSLNIETIAKLSDEYKKLNTGAERQQFLTENLGRSSTQWAEIMSQGSEAILSRGDAVSEMLILDQQALDNARAYEMALDDLNDQLYGLKVSVGEVAVPQLLKLMDVVKSSWSGGGWGQYIRFLDIVNDRLTGFKNAGLGFGMSGMVGQGLFGTGINNITAGAGGGGEYNRLVLEPGDFEAQQSGFENAAAAADYYGQKLDSVTGFATSYQEIATSVAEVEKKIAEARAQGYSETGAKMEGLKDNLAALQEQEAQLANSFILSMLQIKLAADGISDEDIGIYLDMAVNMGIMSAETREAALAMWDLAEAQTAAALAPKPVYGGGSGAGGGSGGGGQEEGWARGGSFSGWGLVGDSPGGVMNATSELVYAPGGAFVLSASQTRQRVAGYASGGAIPPAVSSAASDGMDDGRLREFARMIVDEIHKRAG